MRREVPHVQGALAYCSRPCSSAADALLGVAFPFPHDLHVRLEQSSQPLKHQLSFVNGQNDSPSSRQLMQDFSISSRYIRAVLYDRAESCRNSPERAKCLQSFQRSRHINTYYIILVRLKVFDEVSANFRGKIIAKACNIVDIEKCCNIN